MKQRVGGAQNRAKTRLDIGFTVTSWLEIGIAASVADCLLACSTDQHYKVIIYLCYV